MDRIIIYLFIFGLIGSCMSIKCYRDESKDKPATEATDCPTSGGIVEKAQSKVGAVWKWVKDGIQSITGDDWIDNIGEKIKSSTGLDITSHKKNKEWVQTALNKIGADFDVSGNCYVTFSKTSLESLDRGCGAFGGAGTLSAELLKFMQGKHFNFWANSVCFTKPGNSDQEVCMCNKGECNADYKTAKESVGIDINARTADCGGSECPLANLNKINDDIDFNTACYTYTAPSIGETSAPSEERCLTSDILVLPVAAKLTRSRRSIDDDEGGRFTLTNINGETKAFEGDPAAVGGQSDLASRIGLISIITWFLVAVVMV